jgi:DNA polymerase V
VVVLSNNDGCIVARSNEAKALGIGMGEPEFKVRAFLKEHNVAVFSSNYALYGDISARVMATLESLAPDVEQYSIDEAFVPLFGALATNADELALTLRERVRKWTGIAVSVGVGSTRTLAKIASEKAKKGSGVLREGAKGVFRIDAKSPETDAILAETLVGDIWGIGRRSAEKLILRGIRTAKDLRDADGTMIRKLLSVVGLHTALELRGIPCTDLTAAPAERRTLISSRSFGQRVTDKQSLVEALALHASLAGERLRREKLQAGGIAVHIRTARHGKGPFYDQTAGVPFPAPSASTREFIEATRRGLEAIFRPGYAYAKAGVMLYELSLSGSGQGNLLELVTPKERPCEKALMATLDALNKKMGRGAVRFGAEGPKDAAWHMRHSRRSPRWTTVWDELPMIRTPERV